MNISLDGLLIAIKALLVHYFMFVLKILAGWLAFLWKIYANFMIILAIILTTDDFDICLWYSLK